MGGLLSNIYSDILVVELLSQNFGIESLAQNNFTEFARGIIYETKETIIVL